MSENSVVLKVMMPGAQHFTSLDVPSEVVNLRTLRSHLSEAGHTNVSDAVTYVGETQALDEAKVLLTTKTLMAHCISLS